MRARRDLISAALMFVLTVVVSGAVAAPAARAQSAPDAAAQSVCSPDGTQPHGAVYRICMPGMRAWNQDLVIWAHGYVDATNPVAIPEDQLCLGGTFCIPTIVNSLGFGFATTSYRMNGLVTTGVEDVSELIDLFTAQVGPPRRVYLVGASEGGLVTALSVEQRPDLFDGGLAACGPIGDFHRQVQYYGDFRVLFDYFFPGLMPWGTGAIPDEVIADWDNLWENTVKPAVFDPANQSALLQLLQAAKAPFVASAPETIEKTVHVGVWYNVFASNDIVAKLGGQPFDNIGRVYMGSSDNAALNAQVRRVAADPSALAAIDAQFQTTGELTNTLVRLHTTMDQQVAYMQERLYMMKLRAAGTKSLSPLIPSLRYGHCQFKPWEALLSFAIMVNMVEEQPLLGAETLLPDEASRRLYLAAAQRYGLLDAPQRRPEPKGHGGRH